MSEAPREAPVSEERSAAAGVRGFLDASLSRRFAVVLLALLIPIAMVAASVRQGLFANARELIDALRVGALAGKSLVLVLTQDDVTKELFLDPGAIGLAERKIAAYDENLAILSELRELSSWPELTVTIDQMTALEARLRPLDTEILETLLSGDPERARELYFGEYRERRAEFERLSVSLAALSEQLAADAEARMLERNRATVLQVVSALLLGMAAVAVLILRLSRRVAGRTAAILAVLEDVADGDLRRTPDDASRDELGRIAAALGRAIEGMRGTVLHVAESLERVGDGTREIHRLAHEVGEAAAAQIAGIDSAAGAMASVTSEAEGLGLSADVLAASASESSSSVEKLRAGSEELRANGETLGQVVDGVSGAVSQVLQNLEQVMQRTEELARAAVSTTAGSHRLAHSFDTIDRHAAETEQRSREVIGVVERGREDMERTIIGMAAIREATDEADEAIAVLMKRAGEIDKIVDVITQVGDQTSLLALNAAILATRAGEHGKGFSVVAGEIKTLAASVLTHTREVTLRIDAVQDQAARVAEAIRRGSQRVRAGVEVSREAGENFAAIQAAAHESGERMKQVVDAVRKEADSVERLVELASALDSTVAEIRRSLGEQRRGAGVLRDAAGETTQVADQLRKRADSQSRETRAIADGVEKVRHSSEQIRAAVGDQRRSCTRAGTTLERVAAGGRSNEESARRVRDRLAALEREADELRARIRWFKTS